MENEADAQAAGRLAPDARRMVAEVDARRLKRGATEDHIHYAILQWLRLALPWGAFVHHSPNGGARAKSVGAKLKRLGTVAGYPDLEIIIDGRSYFLEVKRPGGYPSQAQKDTHKALRDAGAKVAVVRSIDDAQEALTLWDIPLKAAA